MSIYPLLLALHIVTGFGAVLTGGVPILTRKGSRAHRLSGRVFAVCMAVLLAAAWAMTILKMNSYLLALSASATLTLFSGLRVLGRKRPDLRRADRAQALDWLVTLGIAGVGLFVLWQVLTGRNVGPAAISMALVYGTLSMGLWDVWRFLRPTDWPFSPELWRYEHLWKMVGAWSAVLSAFSGNYLQFLPAPWSALWPTLVFQTLTLIWIAVLIVQKRRRVGTA
ncbi:hypothetical protein [Brevundimonas sp. FT23042]|uniref:hypothetical protein n=1 Tax=Brevundimonas sp. FT23042 TaxID=3393749 RepID=UPI003B58A527